MPPDEPTDEERLEELAQDNGTPFQPADDVSAQPADDTHPATDTDIDETELYQDGVNEAAGLSETTDGDVASFNPDATKADEDVDNAL